MRKSKGTPEAGSPLCVLSGPFPHDLCHRQDSPSWLPARGEEGKGESMAAFPAMWVKRASHLRRPPTLVFSGTSAQFSGETERLFLSPVAKVTWRDRAGRRKEGARDTSRRAWNQGNFTPPPLSLPTAFTEKRQARTSIKGKVN